MFQLLTSTILLDPVSAAKHSSTNGWYTAAEVEAYRKCSTDYTTKFVWGMDGTFVDGQWHKGFAPEDGRTDKIESFRTCWEPIHT